MKINFTMNYRRILVDLNQDLVLDEKYRISSSKSRASVLVGSCEVPLILHIPSQFIVLCNSDSLCSSLKVHLDHAIEEIMPAVSFLFGGSVR